MRWFGKHKEKNHNFILMTNQFVKGYNLLLYICFIEKILQILKLSSKALNFILRPKNSGMLKLKP